MKKENPLGEFGGVIRGKKHAGIDRCSINVADEARLCIEAAR